MSESVEAEWIIESGERLLRLVLFRAGDRYAHRIELLAKDGELLASASSEEGAASSIDGAAETWPAFETLHGDQGARPLIQACPQRESVPFEAATFDIDTPADLQRLKDKSCALELGHAELNH